MRKSLVFLIAAASFVQSACSPAPDGAKPSATVTATPASQPTNDKAAPESDTKPVRAYMAEGGIDEFHGTGRICDIAQPFTISSAGLSIAFTPASDSEGSYSYNGTRAYQGDKPVAVNGKGTYAVSVDEKGTRIVGDGIGCITMPVIGTRCRTGSHRYTLTPMAPCE